MKFAIIRFGGSNCDMDVHHVLSEVLGVETDLVWYKEKPESLSDYAGVVIPGGFSYGDYLRAGAIAARTPIMDGVKRLATKGVPVLGICNGFQILAESGLVAGALRGNEYPKFRCSSANLRVETTDSPFTGAYKKGDVIRVPIAHAEGNFYADASTISKLNSNDQVAFRYVDENGNPTAEANPNGSVENIAGILNEKKNVLGLMPHPERASEDVLGSSDGRKIFESMIKYAEIF